MLKFARCLTKARFYSRENKALQKVKQPPASCKLLNLSFKLQAQISNTASCKLSNFSFKLQAQISSTASCKLANLSFNLQSQILQAASFQILASSCNLKYCKLQAFKYECRVTTQNYQTVIFMQCAQLPYESFTVSAISAILSLLTPDDVVLLGRAKES
jgi:hypothetical protein